MLFIKNDIFIGYNNKNIIKGRINMDKNDKEKIIETSKKIIDDTLFGLRKFDIITNDERESITLQLNNFINKYRDD